MFKSMALLAMSPAFTLTTASKQQFMIQSSIPDGNGETEILYLSDNRLGPKASGNYYEWQGSNQIAKTGTDYCLQLQPGVHQGCAGPVWTCEGWNYIGTENYRGYDTCSDSSARWVTVEAAQTTGCKDEPVVLLKDVESDLCAYLDTYYGRDEIVQYLGLGDCNATNRALLVLTVHN